MKKIIAYQIDSFTKTQFKGNPASVIINADDLDEIEMQLLANEFNNSETAFITTSENSDFDFKIRYFTPLTEVPICGHATIAAIYAIAKTKNLNSCEIKIKTNVGILPIEIIKSGQDYEIVMTQGLFEIIGDLSNSIVEKILVALELKVSDLDLTCPIQIASTGNPKVMLAINSNLKLNSINPNFNELSKISKEINCNGYFIFTFDTKSDTILTNARMFAPAVGINEDPVTGNAYGPLGGYLVKNKILKPINDFIEFIGTQGEKIGRLGEISVKVESKNDNPIKIQIKGSAVEIYRTEIQLKSKNVS